MEPTTLDRRRLSDQVADRIQGLIADGTLAAGGALPPETALAERFGVSRPTVREALQRLQRMGLVEIRNGAPARVTLPSSERLIEALTGAAEVFLAQPHGPRDFQGLRRVIEVGIAREAALKRGPEDVARLEACLAANRAALDDPEAFGQTDVAFHETLVAIAGNALLDGLSRALNGWLLEIRRTTLAHAGVAARAAAGHAQILDAVAAGDPDAAAAAMDRHLHEIEGFFATGQG